MSSIRMIGGDGYGKKTAAANTRIQYLVGGVGSLYTNLLNIRVATGVTAHILTVMRGASRTKITTDLAAAGTSLVIDEALTDGDANAIAANDLVAVQLDNGSWHLSLVTSWTVGTLTLVLTTAIPTGRTAKRGARVVNYGVPGDTYHALRQFDLTASATNQLPAVAGAVESLCRSAAPGEPLLLDIDNATNASTVAYANVGYAKA